MDKDNSIRRDNMDTAVIVALITGGLAALSNVLVAMMNSKLMIYRIEQLEKKQDKYNTMQERVALIEHDEQTQWKRIDEIKEQLGIK